MELLETVEDSFLILNHIGMEETKESYKSSFAFKDGYGTGGLSVLGDLNTFYYTSINYEVVHPFSYHYRMREHYIELGILRRESGFTMKSENSNDLPPTLGMNFKVNFFTGAKSWFYCPQGTICAGDSLVIREDYYSSRILPNIKKFFGEDIYPYALLQEAGNVCAPLCAGIFNSLNSVPYKGDAAIIYLEAKVNEILAMLLYTLETMHLPAAVCLSDYERKAILHAQEILRTQVINPPSVRALSRVVGLNPNKLQTGFKTLTGATVMDYLRSYRMEKALELISQDILLEEVARQVGYSPQSRFSEAFEKVYDVLPSQYRRMGQRLSML